MPLFFLELSAFAFAFAFAVAYWATRVQKMRIVYVIDGDTYVAVNLRGRKYRIRITDIDCPEIGQPLSLEAKQFVEAWAGDSWLTVVLKGRDKYRRHLASVRKEGNRLEHELLSAGLAYPLSDNLGLRLRTWHARARGRGVWGLWIRTKPWVARRRKKSLLGRLKKLIK